MTVRLPYSLPRHAFSHRNAARAGDVWRAFQDIAVAAASAVGWPPSRFSETGTAFVVRSMVTVHHRETTFGEQLEGASWVRRFRRETLSTREVRLFDAEGAPVASATQEWVHIDATGKPARASREMVACFAIEDSEGVELPPFEARAEPGPAHSFSFRPWYVSMDPLDHMNHPAYVDCCEEALARVLAAAGHDPAQLVPVAETVTFVSSVKAGEEVRVETRLVGRAGDALVFSHRVDAEEREGAARVTTMRRFRGLSPEAFEALFLGEVAA